MTKQQIQKKYGNIPVYRSWNDVPENMISRTEAKKRGIAISADRKPDAVKNSSDTMGERIYLLFNVT